jgi:hypothetical protein
MTLVWPVGGRVIEANGGLLVEEFVKPVALGGTPELRYRIPL